MGLLWKLWKYKWLENSLIQKQASWSCFSKSMSTLAVPLLLPRSVYLTNRQRPCYRFYGQLTIFILRKTYEGDSVQGPWAHTRVPGFEFCHSAFHVYGLWPFLQLSVSPVSSWVGGSHTRTYPIRLLWGTNEFT